MTALGAPRHEKPRVRRGESASNTGHPNANAGILPLLFVQGQNDKLKRLVKVGYLDWALAKRLLISSQLTVFHQAAR